MQKIVALAFITMLLLPLSGAATFADASTVTANKVLGSTHHSSHKSSYKQSVALRDLNSLFRSVFGRNPTLREWQYWAKRLLDKSDRGAFVGAMTYHKIYRINH